MSYADALERLKILKRGGGAGDRSAKSPAVPPPMAGNFRERPGYGGAKSAKNPLADDEPPEADLLTWLNANPPPPQVDPSRCLVCGDPEAPARPLLPILAGGTDGRRRWLHDACFAVHWRRRRAEAVAALRGCAR